MHSPPDLEEFVRIAEVWIKLAEGLDPEASEEQHHLKWKKVAKAGSLTQKSRHFLMPIDPDECRQRALECVRMAQTTKDPDARKIWSEHLGTSAFGLLFERPPV